MSNASHSNPHKSLFGLLGVNRFAPLFHTQFLGAFNDNVFKNALIILITYQSARLGSSLSEGILVNLCAGLFILPYFLFSASAGQLADKFDKAALARATKIAEICIMLLGAIGFLLPSLSLLLGALFLMGLQSTLFSPIKYSLLPQHLYPDELVGGNAWIEAGTFLAILFGTMLGGTLIANGANGPIWVVSVIVLVAVAGYIASRKIPVAPPPAPQLRFSWNPVRETYRNIQFARQNRTVFLSNMGIAWFWFYGALLLTQIPAYVKDYLAGSEAVVTLLLATLSIGIGLGSLLCERMSGKQVEIGLVPFGSIGLSLFAFDLYLASPSMSAIGSLVGFGEFVAHPANWRILADILLIGLFAGFFTVPLTALVQSRAEKHHLARIISAGNILSAAYMVAASLIAIGLLFAGLSVPQLFLVLALMNAAVALYIYKLVPEFLVRFIIWMLMHTVYKLRVQGLENIPAEGGAIIACNHVSFVDALVITAASRRPIRFVMDHRIFRWPILSYVFKTNRCIPIASAKDDPMLLEAAFEEMHRALQAGELIGIFPEGKITHDGELAPFRNGIMRTLERDPVPVVPMALRGLWGSMFSRKDGPAFRRPLRRGLFNKIELNVGQVLQATALSPERLQAEVQQLRGHWR